MAKDTVTAHVRKGVTVIRNGARVRPEIGKNFDFTAEEAESIQNADAGAIGPALDGGTKGEAKTASTTDPKTGKPTTGKRGAPAKSTADKTGAAGAGDDAGSKTNQGEGDNGGEAGNADDDL
jgi:hypothetical protein